MAKLFSDKKCCQKIVLQKFCSEQNFRKTFHPRRRDAKFCSRTVCATNYFSATKTYFLHDKFLWVEVTFFCSAYFPLSDTYPPHPRRHCSHTRPKYRGGKTFTQRCNARFSSNFVSRDEKACCLSSFYFSGPTWENAFSRRDAPVVGPGGTPEDRCCTQGCSTWVQHLGAGVPGCRGTWVQGSLGAGVPHPARGSTSGGPPVSNRYNHHLEGAPREGWRTP